jgi:ubiquinone/menaquinone biosynthesis C-methylase UbiE
MTAASIDYDAWAKRYDDTRGVSPSVLRPLREALGPAVGRLLLDVGGGTGNYTAALTEAGFAVTHCDPSIGMVRQAASKLSNGASTIVADGRRLPFRDESFDCAIAIKVLNHVSDRRAFAREVKRIIHSGVLVLVHATKESIAANWICHYVPSLLTQERFQPESETVQALRDAGFTQIEVSHIRYTDMADGSAQALKRFPETFLTDERIMNTSLFSRLPANVREEALAAIRRDYASGRLNEIIADHEPLSDRHGDGSLFVARR